MQQLIWYRLLWMLFLALVYLLIVTLGTDLSFTAGFWSGFLFFIMVELSAALLKLICTQ